MKKGLLVVLAALVLSAPAYAQQTGLMGKNEVSFAAMWQKVGSDSTTTVQASYGRFVTPNLEPQLGLTWSDSEGSRNLYIAPAVAWHFIGEGTTNVVPYIGVGWYFVNNKNGASESDNGLEAFVGAKLFIGGDYMTSNRAVFVEYRYLNDVSLGGGSGENVNMVLIGITNFF